MLGLYFRRDRVVCVFTAVEVIDSQFTIESHAFSELFLEL